MRRVAGLGVAIGLALATPAWAQDKAGIEKLNDRFAAAFNKGDAASVAKMYAADAVVLPPGAPMVRGQADIQSFWGKAAEQVGDLKLVTLDVKPLGSKALREVGTFHLRSKGQNPQDIVGKYVVVWEKIGGAWKLGTDIWNADK
jgi:uncharacterized protein (TIGR02246 family)